MKDQIISFETAKLAKEKGFNIATTNSVAKNRYCYNHISTTNTEWDNITLDKNPELHSAPTQYLLQKWLREKHKIEVAVIPAYDSFYLPNLGYIANKDTILGILPELMFLGIVNNQKSEENGKDDYYCYHDSWEETLEVILQEGLKLI